MSSGDGGAVRGIVALSYQLPKSVEARLLRDAEARSVRWRQRHGEAMFSPDEALQDCGARKRPCETLR